MYIWPVQGPRRRTVLHLPNLAISIPRPVINCVWGVRSTDRASFPGKRSLVDAACAAVRRAGGVAVVMADFGARDQRSSDVCRAEVRGCDIYLGVIGFRYGTLELRQPNDSAGLNSRPFASDTTGNWFTQREHQQANASNTTTIT